jgi:DNA polymerase II large subunit
LDQGGALAKVKAIHAKTGDRLVFATDVDFGHADDAEIDLFAEFAVAAPPGLMVRGLRPTISAFCETRGLRRAADELGLTMKSLDNYRRRDSTPWRVARRLASRLGKDVRQLPRSLRLAVARDDVEIPRHIALDAPFLRLLGYYLAEGHSRQRQGNHYQVSIASTEPEVAQDVRAAWKHALCLDLPWNGIAITCSSRLVHDLFTRVLDLGSTARTKRIPPRIAALSPDRVAPLLSAYFAGDGNVEKNRLHVSCTSVSRGLLTDVGLQLARHGIPYRLSTSERPGILRTQRATAPQLRLSPTLGPVHGCGAIRATHRLLDSPQAKRVGGLHAAGPQIHLDDALPRLGVGPDPSHRTGALHGPVAVRSGGG